MWPGRKVRVHYTLTISRPRTVSYTAAHCTDDPSGLHALPFMAQSATAEISWNVLITARVAHGTNRVVETDLSGMIQQRAPHDTHPHTTGTRLSSTLLKPTTNGRRNAKHTFCQSQRDWTINFKTTPRLIFSIPEQPSKQELIYLFINSQLNKMKIQIQNNEFT